MKTVIAVNYPDMEHYISKMDFIHVCEIVYNRARIIKACRESKPELLILSNMLLGNEDMKELLYKLTSEEYKGTKIVFLYGEDDGNSDFFCDFIESRGIRHWLIGSSITAEDLENTIKNAVYGYSSTKEQSHYNGSFVNAIRSIYTMISEGSKKVKLESVVDHFVITIYSNHTTGKSHTAWNLSHCIARKGYNTTLLNIDNNYSANIYFGIDEMYYELLRYTIEKGQYKDILNHCYKLGNLSIVTGRLGDSQIVKLEEFEKLLYHLRAKSDITIIDTSSTINESTLAAIKASTVDLFVFDCDLMHFHSNMQMLELLGEDFIAEKTIVVINNCNTGNVIYKFIYNQLKRLKLNFKAIIPLSCCGLLSCQLMNTNKAPYLVDSSQVVDYRADLDKLLAIMKFGEKKV